MKKHLYKKLYIITDANDFELKPTLNPLLLHKKIYALQYRNKTRSLQQNQKAIRRLQRACQRYRTPFIINDDYRLARRIRADGIHIGQSDQKLTFVRKLAQWKRRGSQKKPIIGLSCHDKIPLAIQAQKNKASYIAFGSLFRSKTKPEKALVRKNVIIHATRIIDIPIVVIGGINNSNLNQANQTHAQAFAMIEGAKDFC